MTRHKKNSVTPDSLFNLYLKRLHQDLLDTTTQEITIERRLPRGTVILSNQLMSEISSDIKWFLTEVIGVIPRFFDVSIENQNQNFRAITYKSGITMKIAMLSYIIHPINASEPELRGEIKLYYTTDEMRNVNLRFYLANFNPSAVIGFLRQASYVEAKYSNMPLEEILYNSEEYTEEESEDEEEIQSVSNF